MSSKGFGVIVLTDISPEMIDVVPKGKNVFYWSDP